ncbi:hypothetical protein EPUS_07258 [Endocarpon pusillum Z07020]|uniref:Uncharacterized protein n=1 Tax=Endocarpon pusillum (strain Z07020 / HMAS-L-300199) TaxID=1263415 RepID=U1GAQ6_ENDPU|nr:uncharacterized protein EPUS_07258 [Endocarpon pusillum Z07020]ERF68771.1 hypothetical protein EPUS_07258 [Endocarpon pusillum Z07020]
MALSSRMWTQIQGVEEVLERNLPPHISKLASPADQRKGSGTTRNSTNESKEQARDSRRPRSRAAHDWGGQLELQPFSGETGVIKQQKRPCYGLQVPNQKR